MDHEPSPLPPMIIRWTARILSVLILAFWGFFIISEVVNGRSPESRPLNSNDYLQLGLMAVWLIGLCLAWKWELAGGLVALAAFVIHIFINASVLKFPVFIIPITALLFLISSWLNTVRSLIKQDN